MSGDGQIKVDFGAVQAAAGDIDSTAQQIDARLDDLHRQIENLNAIWEGSASEGFQAKKRDWETAAKDLQQALAQIGAAVGVAHEAYMQAEARNSSLWG
jgi:early secretory antigenic target protein ESAT-6